MSEMAEITRRGFLRNGASFVALSATVPLFLQRMVLAARRDERFRDDGRILVVVQLAGGNDGLNMIVPYRDTEYYKLRPKLAIQPADTLHINDDLGFNGQAKGLKEIYDAGLLSIVQNVGYPNPNRSHFRSMDIWHTASPEGKYHEGWLGRYFDNTCKGSDCDPAGGIALMRESPLAMRGATFLPLAFEKPESLGWRSAVPGASTGQAVTELNQPQPGDSRKSENSLEFLRRVALKARISAEEIHQAAGNRRSAVEFGRNELAKSLETVSRLIGAGLKTRVYYVSHGGYDTHANQAGRQNNLLRDLGEALSSFLQALKAQGDLERVLVMTFSEFGRRVGENASGGTDHGAAAPMMLAGNRIKAGVHGQNPDLTKLEQGDVRFTTDFRGVYSTILDGWLGVRSASVLGGAFARLPVLAGK